MDGIFVRIVEILGIRVDLFSEENIYNGEVFIVRGWR